MPQGHLVRTERMGLLAVLRALPGRQGRRAMTDSTELTAGKDSPATPEFEDSPAPQGPAVCLGASATQAQQERPETLGPSASLGLLARLGRQEALLALLAQLAQMALRVLKGHAGLLV